MLAASPLLAANIAAAQSASATSPPRARTPGAPQPSAELLALAGSCVMTGWYGRGLPPMLRRLLAQNALGGLFVRRNNFRALGELTAICDDARSSAGTGPPPLIAADQEGGPVEHLSPPLTRFPSMTWLGTIDDVDLTRRAGAAIGAELHSVGVNLDLAPVLDVRTSRRNVVDLARAFGSEPARVARHGRAFVDGIVSSGVLACGKHFPGHGDTSVDSHAGLPRVPHGLERLDRVELVPFRACLAQTDVVMLAHVVYEGIDRRLPASLSSAVIEGVLRRHLGFEGLAMSDDLQMAAVRGRGVETAALQSMRAGCDLLLVAHSQGVASSVIRHLASVAAVDPALRTRLDAAAARVRHARERAAIVSRAPAISIRPDAPAIVREIRSRFAALPAAQRHPRG